MRLQCFLGRHIFEYGKFEIKGSVNFTKQDEKKFHRLIKYTKYMADSNLNYNPECSGLNHMFVCTSYSHIPSGIRLYFKRCIRCKGIYAVTDLERQDVLNDTNLLLAEGIYSTIAL